MTPVGRTTHTDVALIASSFLPRFGGVEEHVLNVARRLRTDGRSVVIWAVDQGDREVPAAVDGIPVRYLPTPLPSGSLRGVLSFAVRAPQALVAWGRALRRDRPRVLHVQCFGPNGVYSTVLGRLLRRPLVVSAHGETFMDQYRVFDHSVILQRSLHAALARAAAVTACSRYAADDLRRFGGDPGRVRVIFNGIDLAEPAAPVPAWLPKCYLLAVGRVVEVKGFDLLLDAYAALDTDVPLVVAGDGPALAGLRARAGGLGIGDRVVFPGRLGRGEITTVMAGAVALVVPSRVEAFGITVLEGWRAAVPVIVTSRGGPPEFVEDGASGLVVDPTDREALATALRRVLEDDVLARRLGERGRHEVESFTWDGVAHAYENLYDGLRGVSTG